MGEIDRNASVVKRNELISMSYKLSINEQRLLLGCISQIDSRKELDGNTEFELVIKDLVDLFNLEKTGTIYEEMKEASDRLLKRLISYRSGSTTTRFKWVYKIEWEDISGTIRLWFTPDVVPYLSMITKSFTRYKLKDVSRFKHVYTLRIYELCAQWKSHHHTEITVDELRERLSITDKYLKWSELKRSVLDKSISEINKYSNLQVSYGCRRLGRKIHSIQLHFETKKKPSIPLPPEPRPNPRKEVKRKPRSDSWKKQIDLVKETLKKK